MAAYLGDPQQQTMDYSLDSPLHPWNFDPALWNFPNSGNNINDHNTLADPSGSFAGFENDISNHLPLVAAPPSGPLVPATNQFSSGTEPCFFQGIESHNAGPFEALQGNNFAGPAHPLQQAPLAVGHLEMRSQPQPLLPRDAPTRVQKGRVTKRSGPVSSTVELPALPKPGRKPTKSKAGENAHERRKAQNRNAQTKFRDGRLERFKAGQAALARKRKDLELEQANHLRNLQSWRQRSRRLFESLQRAGEPGMLGVAVQDLQMVVEECDVEVASLTDRIARASLSDELESSSEKSKKEKKAEKAEGAPVMSESVPVMSESVLMLPEPVPQVPTSDPDLLEGFSNSQFVMEPPPMAVMAPGPLASAENGQPDLGTTQPAEEDWQMLGETSGLFNFDAYMNGDL